MMSVQGLPLKAFSLQPAMILLFSFWWNPWCPCYYRFSIYEFL